MCIRDSNMPVQYEGINVEHATVRNAVGVFDVSHMGEFILKGENALDLIQRVTSNDASKLHDGKIQYSCFPNEDGGIVDDLLVYRMDEKSYMSVSYTHLDVYKRQIFAIYRICFYKHHFVFESEFKLFVRFYLLW